MNIAFFLCKLNLLEKTYYRGLKKLFRFYLGQLSRLFDHGFHDLHLTWKLFLSLFTTSALAVQG